MKYSKAVSHPNSINYGQKILTIAAVYFALFGDGGGVQFNFFHFSLPFNPLSAKQKVSMLDSGNVCDGLG